MKSVYDFFRRLIFRFAIVASNSARGTLTSARISRSNLPKPFGLFFLASMSASLLGQIHESGIVLSGQKAPSEPAAYDLFHDSREPSTVIRAARVESELLLAHVAVEMVRSDRNIRALQTPLEQRPEILNAVDVDISNDVSTAVVNGSVSVSEANIAVSASRIREHAGPIADLAANLAHQRFALVIRDDSGRNQTVASVGRALQDSVNGGLVRRAASGDFLLPDVLVHVRGQTADVGRIRFAGSVEFFKRSRLHGLANAMGHKPSSFLGHSQSASQLVATDSVFAIGDRPDRRQPLVQFDFAVLENSALQIVDFLAALLAAQDVDCLDLANPITAAVRASHLTTWPTNPAQVAVANVEVREISDGLKQRLRDLLFFRHLCTLVSDTDQLWQWSLWPLRQRDGQVQPRPLAAHFRLYSPLLRLLFRSNIFHEFGLLTDVFQFDGGRVENRTVRRALVSLDTHVLTDSLDTDVPLHFSLRDKNRAGKEKSLCSDRLRRTAVLQWSLAGPFRDPAATVIQQPRRRLTLAMGERSTLRSPHPPELHCISLRQLDRHCDRVCLVTGDDHRHRLRSPLQAASLAREKIRRNVDRCWTGCHLTARDSTSAILRRCGESQTVDGTGTLDVDVMAGTGAFGIGRDLDCFSCHDHDSSPSMWPRLAAECQGHLPLTPSLYRIGVVRQVPRKNSGRIVENSRKSSFLPMVRHVCRYPTNHPDWSKGRCHNHGMLLATKRIILDLWKQWRCDSPFASEERNAEPE